MHLIEAIQLDILLTLNSRLNRFTNRCNCETTLKYMLEESKILTRVEMNRSDKLYKQKCNKLKNIILNYNIAKRKQQLDEYDPCSNRICPFNHKWIECHIQTYFFNKYIN